MTDEPKDPMLQIVDVLEKMSANFGFNNSIQMELTHISAHLSSLASASSIMGQSFVVMTGYMSDLSDNLHYQKLPHVVFRPEIYHDGSCWIAHHGGLEKGVVGYGDSPQLAMVDFDTKWSEEPAKRVA